MISYKIIKCVRGDVDGTTCLPRNDKEVSQPCPYSTIEDLVLKSNYMGHCNRNPEGEVIKE